MGPPYDPGYSLDEVDTGATWIDGKSIYRKVINTTSPVTNDTSEVQLNVNAGESLDSIIRIHGKGVQASNGAWIPLFYSERNGVSFQARFDTRSGVVNNLVMRFFGSIFSERPVNLVVEYTKL